MSSASRKSEAEAALKQIGDLSAAVQNLKSFKETAQAFSASSPRLIDQFPQKWVAVSNGKVVADAATLEGVWEKVDKSGLGRSGVMVRFITKKHRTMIL